jgi:hypothetical protein
MFPSRYFAARMFAPRYFPKEINFGGGGFIHRMSLLGVG